MVLPLNPQFGGLGHAPEPQLTRLGHAPDIPIRGMGHCAARDTLQSSRSSSRSVSAHDRLARVAGSQFLTVESWLPLVSSLPSELKHTDVTTSVCPLTGD